MAGVSPWAEATRATLDDGGRFDLLVSNPPYIPRADMLCLDPHVADFEDRVGQPLPSTVSVCVTDLFSFLFLVYVTDLRRACARVRECLFRASLSPFSRWLCSVFFVSIRPYRTSGLF